MKSSIVPGSEYQFSLDGLVVVGKNDEGIILHYAAGGKIQIRISDSSDKERQYKEICEIHQKGYYDEVGN